MFTIEHKDILLELLSDRGYDLSFYYKNPERYRIEVMGTYLKFIYNSTNAVRNFWMIGEDLFRNYHRNIKLTKLIEKTTNI